MLTKYLSTFGLQCSFVALLTALLAATTAHAQSEHRHTTEAPTAQQTKDPAREPSKTPANPAASLPVSLPPSPPASQVAKPPMALASSAELSAFKGYRAFTPDEPMVNWRRVNDEMEYLGGHMGHVRNKSLPTAERGTENKPAMKDAK